MFTTRLKKMDAPKLRIFVSNKSATVTILSLAVYYLCVVFYWLDLMEISQEKFLPKTASESKNAI